MPYILKRKDEHSKQEFLITCRMASIESIGILTSINLKLSFGNLTANTSEILFNIQQNPTEMLDANQRENSSDLTKDSWFFELYLGRGKSRASGV